MLPKRNLSADLTALGLLALTVLFALSLLTYDPHDPPSPTLYPPRSEPANLCGHVGAQVAYACFHTFGLGAYFLLGSVIMIDALVLLRKHFNEPMLRTIGWWLTLVSFCTLSALVIPDWASYGLYGPGGWTGAVAEHWLLQNFAVGGAYLLTLSVLFAGLLLLNDVALFRVLHWSLVKAPSQAFAIGTRFVFVRLLGGKLEEENTYRLESEPEPEKPKKKSKQQASPEPISEKIDQAKQEESGPEASKKKSKSRSPIKVNTPASKTERQAVMEELRVASRQAEDEEYDYELPGIDLLIEGEDVDYEQHRSDVESKAEILEQTFKNFGFDVQVVAVDTGPVIAQYEVELAPGLRLSKITGLADDLAIALRVPSVRIVAPIPGKNTVGIEVPNAERQNVRMREVIEESAAETRKMRIPIYLGKNVSGQPMVCDLTKMPHLLIAGRTGTGKSVCMNSLICSMLMMRRPDEVKMLLIDPKQVEFHDFRQIPHLLHPVITDPKKAEPILAWAVDKMEERYRLLASSGVRHIDGYNQLSSEERSRRLEQSDEPPEEIPDHLPYIVILIDEMADLMMTAGKEIEAHIIRLAQKSRAVGIHLVLATQKPTVDVITGLIKSNLPARISFQVASRTDSRVVLDEMGADKLLGMGDMLFLWPGTSSLLRGQGTFISDEEIHKIVETVGKKAPEFLEELLNIQPRGEEATTDGINNRGEELYESAIEIVVNEGRGSVSLLQRSLSIGYGRASRIIDYMAEDNIVGPYNGSKFREVLISPSDWAAMRNGGQEPALPAKSKSKARSAARAEPDWEEEDEYDDEYAFDSAED